jgi:predicted phosphodiesterase
MKLLLVSNTHGDLDIVNRLGKETQVDAVVHAGDLGLSEPASADRLTVKEVVLRILHSHLPREVVKEARKLTPEGLRTLLAARVGLGDFPD